MQNLDVLKLIQEIRKIAKDRDWEKYHTPKNLSMALSVEASELVEIFQWLSAEESTNLKNSPKDLEKVEDEIADILVYLLRMVDVLGIDLKKAVEQKLIKNQLKYPVDKARGNAKKYNEY